MDLRDLHYFEVIAELEHVGKAAQALHRSQPTMTSCLRRLEAMCGGPLIEKTGRGIRLTPAGKALKIWAKRLRLAARDASTELRDVVNGIVGEVRIGFVPSAAQFLFPRIIKDAFAEMPQVRIHSQVAIHAVLAQLLRDGKLDFMVVGESHMEAGFFSQRIMQDAVVPVAARDHPVFDKRKVTLASLSEYSWILQPDNVLPRQWLNQVFDQACLPRPNVQLETNMLNLQPDLIAATGFIGFLPRLQLSRDGPLREIKVAEAVMERRLELRYREGSYISPVARRIMELFVDAGKYLNNRIV